MVQRVLKSVKRLKLRQVKLRRHRIFQDCCGEWWICCPNHSIQASICFFFNSVPQLIHLLSHLPEKIRILFIWGNRPSMVTPSMAIPFVLSISPRPIPSCWSRSLISWFCLVSSSTVATRAWTCRLKAAKSWFWLHLNIEVDGNYVFESEHENVVPTDGAKLMKCKFVSRSKCVQIKPSPRLWDCRNGKEAPSEWSPMWCLP